jgi:hypothetical protein
MLASPITLPGSRSDDDDRTCPPDVQLALLASPRPIARGSTPMLASPYATAVLHTPLTSASRIAVDPRARRPRERQESRAPPRA